MIGSTLQQRRPSTHSLLNLHGSFSKPDVVTISSGKSVCSWDVGIVVFVISFESGLTQYFFLSESGGILPHKLKSPVVLANVSKQ